MDRFLSQLQPMVLCLGVPKAATTWIHRQLEAHPQVACTTTKEVGYWTRNYERGPKWYVRQFAPTNDARVFAEVTPHYLNERALGRIVYDLEEPKFIVVLRDPYERTFSEYLNGVRNGATSLTFAQACRTDQKMLRNSLYGQAIRTYLNFFAIERLHIVMYEEIESEPRQVVENLYRFIRVDADFVPPRLEEPVNVGRSRSRGDVLLKRLEVLSKHLGLQRKHLVNFGLELPLQSAYRYLARRSPAPQMTDLDRKLLAPYIEADISHLERLLGRDFSHWRVHHPRA